MAKRLEVLNALVVLIVNPDNPDTEHEARATLEAARTPGLKLQVLKTRNEREIDAAFATFAQLRPGALLIGSDAFFFTRREHFVALAAQYAVPTLFETREFVTAGGLASYGPSINDSYRQAGVCTGKILKGAKPAELPVLQPTKIELIINHTTARALGLTVPQALLLRADEVIQ
jgi:putative ABC transport system substrate-binding protein